MGNLENQPARMSLQDTFVAAYNQFVRTVEGDAHSLQERLFRVEAAEYRGDPQVSPEELKEQQLLLKSEIARVHVLRALRSGLTYRPALDGFRIISTVEGTQIGVSVRQNGSDEIAIRYLMEGKTVGLEEAGDAVRPYLSAMRDLATGPGVAHLPRR